MSEWVVLGFVAAGLYVVECIAWIEAAALACFKAPLGGGWRCAQGATLPGNDRGGAIIVDPTDVRGSVVLCHLWPVSVSPEGITNLAVDSRIASAPKPRYITFDEFKTLRAEFGEIQINGERLARLSSSVLASALVDQIHRVWRCAPGERSSVIKTVIDETLDDKAASATWIAFQQRVHVVSACCYSLFVFLFLVSPIVLIAVGPYPSWKYLLAVLAVLTLATSVASFRTHSALYPECGYDRWVHSISMMLLPVAAIRCVDKLSRDALCRYSWAVVSPLLCTAESATVVSRQRFIDMNRTARSYDEESAPDGAVHCARMFHQLLTDATKSALDRLNVPVFNPPVRDDETMLSYCPRCHAQFGRGDGISCPECTDVQLVSFDAEGTRAQTGA